MTSSEYIPLTGEEPQSFISKIRENVKIYNDMTTRYANEKVKEWLSDDIDQKALKHDTDLLIHTIEEKSRMGSDNWSMKLAPVETGWLKCQQSAGAILTKYHDDKLLSKNQIFMKAFTKYLRKIYTVLIMNVSQKTGLPVQETFLPKEQKEGVHIQFRDGYFYLLVWF